MTEDIFVYTTLALPDGINEMVDSDGLTHTAYIDKNLTWEEQKKCYDHITAHIAGEAWEGDDADLEEVKAHGQH